MRCPAEGPSALVAAFILGSCSFVPGGELPASTKLSPAQLAEDVEFLFLQLETVHPDVRVNISKERYEKIRQYLRGQCAQPLALDEFYGKVKIAIANIDEGHTFAHPPLANTPEEQEAAVRAQMKDLLAAGGAGRNSYQLLPDRSTCILRYESCGVPAERRRHEALFDEMFARMRKDDIRGLVIDLRKNGGGDSGTNESLIRHLARAPFRQYERMTKRWTPQAAAFYDQVGFDYMAFLKKSYDTSSLALDAKGLPAPGDFTVEARFVDPVEERRRFTGPVYVLISRFTYSSAMLLASTLRHYGLATLIGEETWEFCRERKHYGDVVLVSLPNSRLTFQVSTAVFTVLRAEGESDPRIVPDHRVSQEPGDTEAKIDTVEKFALDMLEERSRTVEVFILAGQSNMEGYGAVHALDEDRKERKGTLAYLARDPAKAPLIAGLRETGAARRGGCEIAATNGNFGDPAPNVRKKLRVEWSYDGAKAERTVDENETLEIPEGPGRLVIEKAVYGDLPGGVQADVTGAVRAIAAEAASAERWRTRDDVRVWFNGRKGPLAVGFGANKSLFGPELGFGAVMGDALEDPVLIIKTAWGGQSLHADFRPPSSGGRVGPRYREMVETVAKVTASIEEEFPELRGRRVELAGFVWWHGWNDGCDPKNAVPEYEANLANLIRDLRRDLTRPDLPVVVGELTGPWVEVGGEWGALRKAQAAAAGRPEFAGNVAFVPTHDFVRKEEDSPGGWPCHEFNNAETYFLVGKALGEAMARMVPAAAKGM